MSNDATGVYTSRITKAGAMLVETKSLLAYWDQDLSVEQNLRRFQQENLFGKDSRSWVRQFLGVFRDRYLRDEPTLRALVVLVKNALPAECLDRILYFHAAQSDRLLHDIVTEVLLPLRSQGRSEVLTTDVERVIRRWVGEGKTTGAWSDNTLLKAAQNCMATLRDFGVLQGSVKKRFAPLYLPVQAFAYVAMQLRRGEPSGERMINHPEWRLFFLSPQVVESLFVEAHQHHLLEYQAAGSIIRITFPTASVEEYAHVILQRTS